VAYGRAFHTVSAIACSLITLAIVVVCIYRYRREEAESSDPDHFGTFMFGALFSSPPGGAACFHAAQAQLVWFAPKVWLIKELASLVAGK
jgi:predicted membrane protein